MCRTPLHRRRQTDMSTILIVLLVLLLLAAVPTWPHSRG
ncbi:MAG: DUF3309 family protein, partial [Gemmatimonadetes bacterium]|nr:DUF3309 family protein [Gemmatimonadota bacterium]